MNEEQLQALLRLKRFEQPPDGYFDQLLSDIHRRQRAELLKRSLFSIALERIQTALSPHSMGPLRFGGAVACAVVFGLGVVSVLLPPSPLEDTARTFAKTGVQSAPNALRQRAPFLEGTPRELQAGLDPSVSNPSIDPARDPRDPEGRFRGPHAVPARATRYVIDPRPASYEPSLSF
jgi:hypothetical protein